jgi:ABC-type polysaccharide/polyol phosphate transport system ATPase subunit
MCNTAALLHEGRLLSFDSMDGAFERYDNLMASHLAAP